ncbi:hypothetical protein [Spirillospora sp. CA-294931]|uniref:hypothetical protein n=1 Tax=Spirillospora sp. CA-294931 TaxID=3240042 RepID=UPI003D8BA615
MDTEVPLLVMEDLGEAPSLADVLLGDDPRAAEDGLLVWARGLGRLAVEAADRRGELRELWARFDKGVASWEDEPWVARNAAELLELVGGAAVPGLGEELAWVGTAGGEEYSVFTPGDTCPDNNLLTTDGLRLIDFETACYQSAFLVAAYCRMPFSTCWCVFRLPAGVAARVEAAYRAEVVGVYPALADDGVWEAGVRQAIVVWTVAATAFLLPRTVEDGPLHPTRRPAPSRRQLLKHRWEKASELEEFPAFAAAMRWLLREVAGGWDVAPLAGYPAFGGD